MAIKDKIKWNEKYTNNKSLLKKRPQSKKLSNAIKIVKGNLALDVACGVGRNSIFLAQNGFEVEALDISSVALEELDKNNYKNIKTKQIDLESYCPKEDSYNLIVMTNYLDRNLIEKLYKALKKDGILFIETYMFHKENEKTPSNPNFLLKENELKTFFKEEGIILDYEEFFNEPFEMYKMRKQAIIIKKSNN